MKREYQEGAEEALACFDQGMKKLFQAEKSIPKQAPKKERKPKKTQQGYC